MPGAYAHITLVNHMRGRMAHAAGFPDIALMAVLKYLHYCELGAVSPDYPYLAIGDGDTAKWADAMHYTRTGEVIHSGVEQLRSMMGSKQQKCLAWLLGYAAHVTTDVTIHPVVELRVGPYAENKGEHRVCEMHQDAHIFQTLNLGQVGVSEHLDSGIRRCGNNDALDPDIREFWLRMLRSIHPEEFETNPPDIDKWHRGFVGIVDTIEEGGALPAFARHVAAGAGLTYPAVDDLDPSYLYGLETPSGRQDYDTVFEAAKANVEAVWVSVAQSVLDRADSYREVVANWNLDTGRDDNDRLVFWS